MNTVQYKCPNCGGELVFNPEKQMFSCPYCMSDFTEAEMEERYHTQNETAQKEADADAKTLKDENDEAAFEEHTRLYECPSCGAQIIADETTSATFCYYCHNPVVLAGRLKGNYKPAYVCHSPCSEMPLKRNFGRGAGNAGFCHLISAPNSSWKK